MSFNAGSITTSLSFELSASGKSALKSYEAALNRAKKEGHMTAKLDAKVDDRGFKSYEKTSDRVNRANTKTKGSFRSTGKAAAGYAAAFLGSLGLISVLKGSVTEAEDAQKAQAQVAASLKATGHAAGLTAKEIEDMSTKLGRTNFIDNDDFMKASSVMLTFKSVTKDTFQTAMQAAADLQGKFGGDLQKSTIQLGKALQDPVKGISALSRVGVSFSASQKKQIEGFVKQGKTVEAQQLILKEVNGQVAGSAAANATASEKMSLTYKDMQEQLGKALIPALGQLVKVMQAFNNLSPAVKQGIVAFAGFAAVAVVIAKVVTALKILGPAFKVALVAIRAFGVSSVLALGPIGLAIIAFVAIVALIIWKWKDVRKALGAIFNWLKGAAKDAFEVVKKAARSGLLGPVALIISRWGEVKAFLGKTWNWMKNAGSSAFSFLKKIITSYIGFYTSMPGKIGRALAGIFGKISSPFIKAFNAIKRAATDAFNFVKDKAKNSLPGKVIGKIGGFLGLSEGGKVGPGAGGPRMYVAGEGGKDEWVISQEGDRRQNIGWAMQALQALGVPMFAKGGIASGKNSITRLQRSESLKEQDIARITANAGIDGVTTPTESQAILDQKAKLSTLYRTEQDVVLRVLALINSERSAIKQDMRGTKGNKRQKLADKLANLDGDKSTYSGRKDELRGILGQAAAEIATGNNDLLALAAVDTSADGSIQAARDALLLEEVVGGNTADEKKTLASAIRRRVDELTARFRNASGPSRAAIGDALSSSFSEWKGLQDDTSASSSSLGFSQQVSNLTSARMNMYQSAGNAVKGTTVNLAVNGLQTTSDPHLFARRVQAELALI